MMRRSIIFLVLFTALCGAARAAQPMTVLASLEATTALGRVLTQNTAVRVVNAVPAQYGMSGQTSYFKRHGEAFFKLAEGADAVLTVGAAWPEDPLFMWARRANIRVVNVDASKPLDGYGAGVPLVEVAGQGCPYVWRSPANLTRMAAIAADDLCRLAPGDASIIRENLKELQGTLFRLRARFEGALLDAAFTGLAALTAGYASLTDEFGLDVRFYLLTPEHALTEADLSGFSARLAGEGVRAVVCPWEPKERVRRAISAGGAVSVVLEPFKPAPGKHPLESLADWYGSNLSRLVAALNQ